MLEPTIGFEPEAEPFTVTRFSVDEEMSAPFVVSLLAHCDHAGVDLRSLLGRAACLRLLEGSAALACWTGIVREVHQLEAEAAGLSTYSIQIVPRLWLTTQRVGSRIFQHASAVDIASTLLAEHGIEPDLKLDRGRHPRLEMRVQYGETDYTFLSRILEEAGISFYFAGAESKLVLCDNPHLNEVRPGPPLPYSERPNERDRRDHATAVRVTQRVVPGAIIYHGHDFRRASRAAGSAQTRGQPDCAIERYVSPTFVVEGKEEGSTPVADDQGFARSLDSIGAVRAEDALLGEQAGWHQVELDTNAVDLHPGSVFSIVGHPQVELRSNRDLLVRATRITGSHHGLSACAVHAVRTESPYRPAVRAPKPVMGGIQSAVVVGPPGEEIHTDEYGRVRVQFHWDREGARDDRSSPWIRVSQPWAGAGFGMIAIPRVGEEVLVDFVGGDPDEPIVIGRVYNARMREPHALPDQRTRSGQKTRSTPGGDGYNEITMEDRKGEELFLIHAQRDLKKLVKHDEIEHTGRNRTIHVEGDMVLRANGNLLLKSGKDLVIEGGRVDINCREEG